MFVLEIKFMLSPDSLISLVYYHLNNDVAPCEFVHWKKKPSAASFPCSQISTWDHLIGRVICNEAKYFLHNA